MSLEEGRVWIQGLPPTLESVREPGLQDIVRLVLGKLEGCLVARRQCTFTVALGFLQSRMHLIKRKEGQLADTFPEVAFSMSQALVSCL